jgi:hypothetical protein
MKEVVPMLGKLLKYDLKSIIKIFIPVWLTLLLIAAIKRLAGFVESDSVWGSLSNVIPMVVFVLLTIAMFVITIVFIVQRFYNGLLKDEGYLMFTIPAKPWQLIASKGLSAIIMIFASGIVCILSILIIYINGDMLAEMEEISGYIQLSGPQLLGIGAAYIGSLLLGMVQTTFHIYLSIAIGHLFSKYRIAMSITAFICINIVMSVISNIINITTGYTSNLALSLTGLVYDFGEQIQSVYSSAIDALTTSMLMNLAITIVFFIITERILSRKLNLE